MYTNMGSPPIIEYEKIVHPVAVTARGMALSKRDQRNELKDNRKRRRREQSRKETEDVPYEPFVGKLFDYSA